MAAAVDTETSTEVEVKLPKQYKVIIHNDDVTTFDFVIFLLNEIFHKSYPEAVRLTHTVHEQDYGVAGVYNHEIAEEKTDESLVLANKNGFPLRTTYEEV